MRKVMLGARHEKQPIDRVILNADGRRLTRDLRQLWPYLSLLNRFLCFFMYSIETSSDIGLDVRFAAIGTDLRQVLGKASHQGWIFA